MRLRTATDIGAVIRERRRASGLDQRTLAAKVGVSRKWIIEVEKGKPRAALRLVLRTLDVLGIVLRIAEAAPARAQPALPSAAVDLDRILQAHRRPRRAAR
jgi:HTH-type transcriptional regulator/antitoxin HipB